MNKKSELSFFAFFSKHPVRKPVWVLIVFALLWAALNYPVMITLWRHGFDDGTYSHSFLIPLIEIYLFVNLAKNGELHSRRKPAWLLAGAALLCVVVYFFAIAGQIMLLVWTASIMLLGFIYLALFRFSWGLAYTVAFLVFMYPMWGALQTVLQVTSVFAVKNLMTLTGIPTFVENTSVMIPAGTFVIAGGCSGLRYFLVSLAIGSLYVFLNLRRPSSIVKFMTLAIAGALITNWLRIAALVVIGHVTEMQSSLMGDHNNFGWYIYAPFVILLFWYGEKLLKQEPVTSVGRSSVPTDAKDEPLPPLANFIIAGVIALFSSSALHLSLHAQPITVDTSCDSLKTLGNVAPVLPYKGAICVQKQRAKGNEFDTLSISYDGSDLDGKPTQYQVELIPLDWDIVADAERGNWRVAVAQAGGQYHLFAYGYTVDGKQTVSLTEMKKWRIESALKNYRRSGLVWAHTPCAENCRQLIKDWPAIQQDLDFVRY